MKVLAVLLLAFAASTGIAQSNVPNSRPATESERSQIFRGDSRLLIDKSRSIDSLERERRSEDSVRALRWRPRVAPTRHHPTEYEDIAPGEDTVMPQPKLGTNLNIYGINFKADSYEIDASSIPALLNADSLLRLYPMIRLSINGHTDNIEYGSEEDRKVLSYDRANAVRQWLIEARKGREAIDPTRLESRGYGEFRPIATNKTVEGRKKNRRIEFQIIDNQYQSR